MTINMEEIKEGMENFLITFGKGLENTVKEMTGATMYLDTTNALAVTKTIFAGLSDTACLIKDPNKTIALAIMDLKGNPLLSLVVGHSEGTKDNNEGSWDIAYKFGPLDDGIEIHDLSEQKYHVGIIKRGSIAGFEFQDPSLIYTLLLSFANAINEYLDKIANPSEKVETVLEGYCKLIVDVVNDKKVFNISIEEPLIKAVVGSDKDEKTVKA